MNDTATLAYVTLFAPLAATVLITLFTLKSKAMSMALALGGIVLGLACSAVMATHVFGGHAGPPQSTSVSLAFLEPSLQLGVAQSPARLQNML